MRHLTIPLIVALIIAIAAVCAIAAVPAAPRYLILQGMP